MSRYIDAEAFKEWIENWFYKHKSYHPYAKTNTIPITELYDILEQMPAADVEEVRHGRWENDGHTLACSNCHTINIRGVAWDYCPYCGSRMDLDEVK